MDHLILNTLQLEKINEDIKLTDDEDIKLTDDVYEGTLRIISISEDNFLNLHKGQDIKYNFSETAMMSGDWGEGVELYLDLKELNELGEAVETTGMDSLEEAIKNMTLSKYPNKDKKPNRLRGWSSPAKMQVDDLESDIEKYTITFKDSIIKVIINNDITYDAGICTGTLKVVGVNKAGLCNINDILSYTYDEADKYNHLININFPGQSSPTPIDSVELIFNIERTQMNKSGGGNSSKIGIKRKKPEKEEIQEKEEILKKKKY